MTHLVYHDLSRMSGQSSPFDEAVLKVCRSGTVGIVSPYIGVDYLQRIIQVSEAWRLISDIEAWLSSLSMRARPKAWQFIRENLDRIHHCPAIHAKVVIGPQSAMLGSASHHKEVSGCTARRNVETPRIGVASTECKSVEVQH